MNAWWVAYAVCAAVALIGSLAPIINWPTAWGALLYAVGVMLFSPVIVAIWTLVGIYIVVTRILEGAIGR